MCKRSVKVLMFVTILLTAGLIFGQTSYAAKNGWSGQYFYKNGKKQTSQWVKDKHGTYYVNSSGKKVTGWKKIGKKYYYFNESEGGKLRNSKKKTGVRLSKLSNEVITIGLDMSQWQGKVNWNKIKKSGVDFVMLRLGYGKGRYGSKKCTMDKKFKSYVEGAKKAGIPIGIYFYSYAKTPEQALQEAEFTIEKLDGIEVSFPVAFDIEDPAIVKATNTATRTEMVQTFLDTVAAAGYTPMFYCNQDWYNNYLNTEELEKYEFWYARYTYVEPEREDYPYAMWQSTSTHKISGITENTVDLNFLYEDYFESVTTRKHALKYGWHKEDGDLYYYDKGKKREDGWLSIAGEKYYLRDGTAVTGWRTISGKKYYFNKKGEMQTGYTKVKGKIYLLNSKGVLQTSTKEPGVTIRSDGSCKIKKGWYKKANGKYIYRTASGTIAKKTFVTVKGKKYYCDGKGYRVTGFKTIKGHKYYFKSNGQMVRSKTIKIKGKKYKFNKKGYLVKKW